MDKQRTPLLDRGRRRGGSRDLTRRLRRRRLRACRPGGPTGATGCRRPSGNSGNCKSAAERRVGHVQRRQQHPDRCRSDPGQRRTPGAALTPTVTITGVTIASPPVVHFSISDARRQRASSASAARARARPPPLPRYPNLAFAMAKLVPARTAAPSKWVSYIVTSVPSTTTRRRRRRRPSTDNTGTLVDNGNGTYTYTFYRDITTIKDAASRHDGQPAEQHGRPRRPDVRADAGAPADDPALGQRAGDGHQHLQRRRRSSVRRADEASGRRHLRLRPRDRPARRPRPTASREIVADNQVQRMPPPARRHSRATARRAPAPDSTAATATRPATASSATPTSAATAAPKPRSTAATTAPSPAAPSSSTAAPSATCRTTSTRSTWASSSEEELRLRRRRRTTRRCSRRTSATARSATTARRRPTAKTAQGDNWKTCRTALACGACHDGINFATGNGVTMADAARA